MKVVRSSRSSRSSRSLVAVLALGLCLLAAPAVAAGPVIERIPIDDEFVDEFLSEACGVEVLTKAKGFLITRTSDDGTGPTALTTINVGLTASAGGNTVRFRDVGADLVRVAPDGTLVLSIIGQVPFQFTGVLKLNPETGEILQEPQNTTADEVDRVCARLTA